jgi:hypothetical protein
MRYVLAGCILSLTTVAPLGAQGLGVAGHAGTLGLGVDVAVAVTPRIGIRAGANFFPTDIDLTVSDLDYTIDLPSPQFTAVLDLYLLGGLRLSGGLFASSDDINLVGMLSDDVEIGDDVYTPSQVGTLIGSIINDDLGPYIGIGFGNPAASRIGFFLDLGVAFQGAPEVALTADGPVTLLPSFQADLEAERVSAEEDLEMFQYYPVLSIGFSIRLSS